jgi:catechol 2,3-dioxygenase-like lactoylglutathione lyase family enzyme
MITGMHAVVYTTRPEEMRAFFRDVLALTGVDAGDGWLIFALPPAEIAVHPIDHAGEHHELTLMCDDIEATVVELRGRGGQFAGDVTDRGWGRTIQLLLPDATQLMLYEPRHPVAAG